MRKYRFPGQREVDGGVYMQYLDNVSRTEATHEHPFFQILFLLGGRLSHCVGGTSAELTVGEMAIIPPYVPHRISLSDAPVYYSLSFNLGELGEVGSLNEQTVTFLRAIESGAMPVFPKVTVADGEILHTRSIFDHVEREIREREPGYKENVTAYIILLINQFIRRYFVRPYGADMTGAYTGTQAVLACIPYIDTHFTEEVTLSKMAERAAVSVSTFCRCFKQVTGKSLVSYLKHKRISYANELIGKGYEITAVASFAGFKDFSTFSRAYKAVMGISPATYRRSLRFLEK